MILNWQFSEGIMEPQFMIFFFFDRTIYDLFTRTKITQICVILNGLIIGENNYL